RINTLIVLVLFSIGLLVSFLSFSAFNNNKSNDPKVPKSSSELSNSKELTNSMPVEVFGLKTAAYQIKNLKVQRSESLSIILDRFQINALDISKLVKASKPIFDVRHIATGKPYTIITSKNNSHKAEYLIYQPNIAEYIVYNLNTLE